MFHLGVYSTNQISSLQSSQSFKQSDIRSFTNIKSIQTQSSSTAVESKLHQQLLF